MASFPPTVTITAQSLDNCSAASDNVNHSRLSLEAWMSLFTTAGHHSFLHKLYNQEARSWYYILHYQGDLPLSALSQEWRHWLVMIRSERLVVEKRVGQGERLAEMRLEIWPTSAKSMTSCHYRCVWRVPVAVLKSLDEVAESDSPKDSGYNSDATLDSARENLTREVKENRQWKGKRPEAWSMQERWNRRELAQEGGQDHGEDEFRGLAEGDPVGNAGVSYLMRTLPSSFQAILWNRPSVTGASYSRCTRSTTECHIQLGLERDAAMAAGATGARRNFGKLGGVEAGVMSIGRELQVLQMLEDVVVRRPFQHNNLEETLWSYAQQM
ncbi:hypothetical protein AYO21_02491 [Fonsecaea monophora]|uniref:Uncharacterized protein n=1 Tax=Fonsecaea monophora TaxID=254056 RepID=A0A177FG43_9EURO|nr:hypothetical protein AYO21_02491 [Fonsecaea monophora]KAH0834578.1 hypothetical protein FOPE_03727 [Fonsecaea pedrosoi]OAG43205.1 hypothetical protein AYO21_02491 [Fonsecaea monophora]